MDVLHSILLRLLALCLGIPLSWSFIPKTNYRAIDALSRSHTALTRQAVLVAVSDYLTANFTYSAANFTSSSSHARFFRLLHEVDTFSFTESVLDLTHANAAVDVLLSTRDNPSWHYDAEKFVQSNQRLLDNWRALSLAINSDMLQQARTLAGQYLHALQDFYSHSNWIEMGQTQAYEVLGAQGREMGKVAGEAEPSCVDCFLQKNGSLVCVNNIIETLNSNGILTSGYYPNQFMDGYFVPKPLGKCSHGGLYDTTSSQSAVGGINKDTLRVAVSPHYYLHLQASQIALRASVDFLSRIRQAHGDNNFARFLQIPEKNSTQSCEIVYSYRYPEGNVSMMSGTGEFRQVVGEFVVGDIVTVFYTAPCADFTPISARLLNRDGTILSTYSIEYDPIVEEYFLTLAVPNTSFVIETHYTQTSLHRTTRTKTYKPSTVRLIARDYDAPVQTAAYSTSFIMRFQATNVGSAQSFAFTLALSGGIEAQIIHNGTTSPNDIFLDSDGVVVFAVNVRTPATPSTYQAHFGNLQVLVTSGDTSAKPSLDTRYEKFIWYLDKDTAIPACSFANLVKSSTCRNVLPTCGDFNFTVDLTTNATSIGIQRVVVEADGIVQPVDLGRSLELSCCLRNISATIWTVDGLYGKCMLDLDDIPISEGDGRDEYNMSLWMIVGLLILAGIGIIVSIVLAATAYHSPRFKRELAKQLQGKPVATTVEELDIERSAPGV